MTGIRAKMDEIRENIDKADEKREEVLLQKAAAVQRLNDIQMHLEESQRHKQSIELRLRSSKKSLQQVTDKLEKVEGKDQSHLLATEEFERMGEVHDTRITNLQEKISDQKTKFNEALVALEDAKRKVKVLKHEIELAKKKKDAKQKLVSELEDRLQYDGGLTDEFEAKNTEKLEREYELENAMDGLKERILNREKHIDSAEREIPLLRHRMEVVKREIQRTKDQTRGVKNDLRQATEEMQDFVLE